MNFLELVQRTRRECSSKATLPTTVVDQIGINGQLVNWVSDAWVDLQSSQEHWRWMRKPFSFPLTVSEADYPPFATVGVHANIANFARWHTDTFRLYRTVTGVSDEQFLVEFEWDEFRDTYRFGPRAAQTRPGAFGIRPHDDAILFDAAPDDLYTCNGEYQEEPARLAADDDLPAVEDRFHMLIVYYAMIKYGIDQAAPEVVSRAQAGIAMLQPEFERRYLPKMRL